VCDPPHDEIIDALVAMAQQIADGRDFRTKDVGEIAPSNRWELSGSLRRHSPRIVQ
jgi:hypothetical protein